MRSYFVRAFHEIVQEMQRNEKQQQQRNNNNNNVDNGKKDLYKTYLYFSVFARCLHTIKTYPHIFLSFAECRALVDFFLSFFFIFSYFGKRLHILFVAHICNEPCKSGDIPSLSFFRFFPPFLWLSFSRLLCFERTPEKESLM